jgi:hypothetical protein
MAKGVPMRQILRVFFGLLLLVVLVGCGPTRSRPGVVSGKVTYKERPVNDAALLLYPADGSATDPLTVPVTAEGDFRITDTPRGEYRVVVQGAEGKAGALDLRMLPPDQAAELKEKMKGMSSPTTIPFPKKYKDLKTTDLRCTITDRDEERNFELRD